MKLLKKTLTFPIALMLMLIVGVSFMLTACGDPYKNVKVVLPDSLVQNQLVLELGEDNTASSTFAVSVEGAPDNVSKQVLASTTSEKVVAKTKFVSGNISEITVTATGIVNNVQVVVTALDGQKSSSFYVSSIKKVSSIQQSSDLSLAFVTINTPKNLTNELISFSPIDTTEKDVEFSLAENIFGASINNNILVVTEDYVSVDNTIEIIATSKSNSQITTRILLNVLNPITYSQYYYYNNGENQEPITPEENNNGYYEFKIANNLQSRNSLLITILANSADYIITPKFKFGDIAEVVSSSIVGSVYNFYISPKGDVGSDELVFEIKHSQYDQKITTEKVIISAYDTVSVIRTYQEGELVENKTSFDVYDFYANVRGLELSFVIGPSTVPEGDRGLTIELGTGTLGNFIFYDFNGNILNYTTEGDKNVIKTTSGATIYVVANGNVNVAGNIKVVSDANKNVSIDLSLNPKVGAKKVEFNNAVKEGENSVFYLTSNESMTKQIEFLVSPTNSVIGDVVLTSVGNAFEIASAQPIYKGTTDKDGETYNLYYIEITSKENFEEIGELRIRFSNGQLLKAKVEVFKALDDNVTLAVPTPQETSSIGRVLTATIDGQDVFIASIKRGENVNLKINANTNVNVKYDFSNDIILGQNADFENAYAEGYQNAFLSGLPADNEYQSTSSIVNSLYLNNYNQIIASGEGKVLVRAKITGFTLQNGKKVEYTITKYFIIESYVPITSMLLSRSSATLYSKDSVGDANINSTFVNFNVIFNNGNVQNQPTYNKLSWFIQGNEVSGTTDIDVVLVEEANELDRKTLYTITITETNSVSINAESTYQLVAGGLAIANMITDNILVKAVEFGQEINRAFNLTIRRANKVENIILDNVTEENGVYLEIEKFEGEDERQDQITYVLAHADTSNNPLNTNLIYEFLPNSNSSPTLISVDNTGKITLSKNQIIGGTGYIRIAPEDCYINGRYVVGEEDVARYIPVKVADGRSRETSYEEEDIDTIKAYIQEYPDLYYTLTKDLQQPLTSPLDTYNGKTVTFNGGFFAKKIGDDVTHTIILSETSLFTTLGNSAIVEDVTLVGEAKGAFVALINNGTINNVVVDTWVDGDEYKASTVTALTDNDILNLNIDGLDKNVSGGIASVNIGTITNCNFYGIVTNENALSYVGGIAGENSGNISYCKVEFYRYENAFSNIKGNVVGGLVGKMTDGTLSFSFAYSYVKVNGDNNAYESVLIGLDEGSSLGSLVGEISNGEVNACFASVKNSNFAGNEDNITLISYVQNAYLFGESGEYRIIANSLEIDNPPTYPDNGNAYKNISFGSDKLWNFDSLTNNRYPYFNAIMQEKELDSISEFDIKNTDLSLAFKTEDNENYVIFFYYEPEGMSLTDMENAVVASWNTISLKTLFGLNNTSSIRISVSNNAPLFTGSEYLTVNDVVTGTFTFTVFSKYDYTLKKEYNATIIYKIQDFKLDYFGRELGVDSTISIKHGDSDSVSSSISTSKIAINRAINLKQNDLEILSVITDINGEPSTVGLEIDGTKIGVHNIVTAKIQDYVYDNIKVSLKLYVNGLDEIYNNAIAETYVKSFNVKLYNGADKIEAETNELSIEPVDSFAQTVQVVIYTDKNVDENGNQCDDLMASFLNSDALKENGFSNYNGITTTITKHNEDGTFTQEEVIGYFGVESIDIYDDYRIFSNGFVSIRIENVGVVAFKNKEMTEIVEDIYSQDAKYFKQIYEVSFGILDDSLKSLNYDGQLFEISLYADSTKVSTTFNLTVETQQLSYINTSHYLLNSTIWEDYQGSDRMHYVYDTIPKTLLAPGKEGLLNVELYPTYSNYSYIEVTSNTILGSSYQVKFGLMEKVDGTKFVRKTFGYETITNGIRIFKPNLSQDIGSLYLRTFIPSDVDADTIYELSITAYNENGEALKTNKFMLSVQHVSKPDLNVNGDKQAIIARGGSGEVTISVNVDQTIDALGIENVESGTVSYDPLTYTVDENTGLKNYTTTLYASTDLTPKNGDNYIIVTATTRRVINGVVETAEDVVYVAITDFVINPEGTQLKTDAYNKDVLTLYVGTTQKLEFDFDVDSYLPNSLNLFNQYKYYNSNPEETYDQKNSYIVNGFYDELPYDFDLDSSNGVIVANFIDNLYYADTYNPDRIELSKVFNRQSGQISSNNYCAFSYDGSNLYVRGLQATTGSVNLLLRIPIQIPNGTSEPTKTYLEYYFTINVVLETNEDKPVIIDSAEKFLNIVNNEEALDYILTEDIYLLDYTPISTSMIRSFDGNNKTIHILSYNVSNEQSSIKLALFDEVSQDTTLKNIRVNTYFGGNINLSMTNVTSVDIAGFAITNNGIITNCEVVSYYVNGTGRPEPSTQGIVVNYGYSNIDIDKVQSRVAGFVVNNNNGSITNSRVGGLSLEVANSTSIIPTVFNIVAQGNIAGFVYENTGIIASSFFMNGTIVNQTSSGSDTSTAGFVINNLGEIRLSYAKGVYANSYEIHATGAGIQTASVSAGFVYQNEGIVEDSYSNIMLTTLGDKESGRLSAGFVYINTSDGIVRRCYSASRIENSNSTQMNFLGVDVNLDLQNYGLVENCYYYNSDTSLDDEYAGTDMESLYNTSVNRIIDPDVKDSFYGFAFSNSSVEGNTYDGVWYMTVQGPELVSANNIAISSRILKVEETNSDGDIVDYSFVYADGYRYGSSKNPIIIRNADEFNQVFGGDTANVSSSVAFYYDLVQNKVFGNYRIVDNIDLSSLLSDETGLTLRSTEMSLVPTYSNNGEVNGLGLIDGNSFTVSGIELVSTLGGANTSYGLFKELDNGAVIMNLNLEIKGVNATGVNYVGALSGTIKDSKIININISNGLASENAVIYGYNLAGGVAGRIIGNSYLSNISVENLTVVAGNDVGSSSQQFYNRSIRNNISYAGGIAGVIDIYTNINDYKFSTILSDPNAVGLKASGNTSVYGATVGGIVGFLGPQTMLQDALYEISSSQGEYSQKLVAYKFAAGGIVGENYGYLFMVRTEHSSNDQLEIENNYSNYYNNSSAEINRGNLKLFEYENSTSYKPKFIGGIVGEFVTGKLDKAYSKLNVTSTLAEYAGGIIGAITDRDNSSFGGLNDYGYNQTYSLTFSELYSTGDLLANTGAGGIFGLIEDGVWKQIELEKINAINYLSVPEKQGTLSGEYTIKDGKKYLNNVYDIYFMPEGSNALNILINQTNYDVNALEKILTNNDEFYFNKSLSSAVISENPNEELNGEIMISTDVQKISELINSSLVDYANEMNKIFRNAGWDQEYWTTETEDSVPHLFPHLTFKVEPSVIYIREASDLVYLQQYKNKTFIIVGNDVDGCIIKVGDYLATTKQGFTVDGFSGLLRGRTDTEEYGFDFTVYNSTEKITAPLFNGTLTGAQFSNFVITGVGKGVSADYDYRPNISSILVNTATGTTFNNITVRDCSISYTIPSTESNGYNIGLLCAVAEKSSFSDINFDNTTNAGNEVEVKIPSDTDLLNKLPNKMEISVGVLTGYLGTASSVSKISNIKFNDSFINIYLQPLNNTNKDLSLNVGHIAGASGSIDLDLINYENINDSEFNLKTNILCGENYYINTLNAGGLIGKVVGSVDANLAQKYSGQDGLTFNYSLYSLLTDNEDDAKEVKAKTGSVGGLFGSLSGSTSYQFLVDELNSNLPFRYIVNNNIKLDIYDNNDNSDEIFYFGGALGNVTDKLLINNVKTDGEVEITSNTVSYVGGVVGYVKQSFNANYLWSSLSLDFNCNAEKDNVFAGIVGYVGYSVNGEESSGVISTIQNTLNESYFDINAKKIIYGGIVGAVPTQKTTLQSNILNMRITNSVSGGEIIVGSNKEIAPNSVRVGGIVGSLSGLGSVSDSDSSNVKIVYNLTYTDLQFKQKPSSVSYVGGLVGLGARGAILHTNYSLASIIFPYSRDENSHIGALMGAVSNATSTDGNSEFQNYYSNQLALMTATDTEVNSLVVKNIGYEQTLSNISNNQNFQSTINLISSVHYGSKLNPFHIEGNYIKANNNNVAEYNTTSKNWAIIENKEVAESVYNLYLGAYGEDPFSTAMPERKYFVIDSIDSVDNAVYNIQNITLNNGAIFGDGIKISIETEIDSSNNYISNNFINILDENSFVTGVQVAVDIRTYDDSQLTHYYVEEIAGENNSTSKIATAYYGGLVGINKGIVYACNTINSQNRSDDAKVQTTMGTAGGISVNNVPDTYGTENVSVNNLIVGGLVAINETTGYIADSFSMVDIVTDSSTVENVYLAGLVGKNKGQIDSCYSTGFVQNNANFTNGYTYSFSYDENENSVSNSYSIAKAKVKTDAVTKGEIGVFGKGAGESNYYDINSTEISSNNVKELTVDDMSTYTFNGTTFNTGILNDNLSTIKFTQNPLINYGYPYFGGTGFMAEGNVSNYMIVETGDGTKENPFQIQSAGKWQQLTKSGGNGKIVTIQSDYYGTSLYNWDAHFELIYNIDFESAEVETINPVGTLNSTNQYLDEKNNYFSGTFNGNDNIISNVEIVGFDNTKNNIYQNSIASGLFGYVGPRLETANPAEIKNVILENVTVENFANSSKYKLNSSAGGIAGIAKDAIITNCYVINSSITGFNNAGGIVGYAESGSVEISKCANISSSVKSIGNRNTLEETSVDDNNIIVYVDITAGGILGFVNENIDVNIAVNINECYNTGEVVAGSEVADNGSFSDPSMADSAYAGGILGAGFTNRSEDYSNLDQETIDKIVNGEINSIITIKDCYNKGNIRANANVPDPENNRYFNLGKLDDDGNFIEDENGDVQQFNDAYKLVAKTYLMHSKYENSMAQGDHNYQSIIYAVYIRMVMRDAYASGIANNDADIISCYNIGEITNNEDDIVETIKKETNGVKNEDIKGRIDITYSLLAENYVAGRSGEFNMYTTQEVGKEEGDIPEGSVFRRDWSVVNGKVTRDGKNAGADLQIELPTLTSKVVEITSVSSGMSALAGAGTAITTKLISKGIGKLVTAVVPVAGVIAEAAILILFWDNPKSDTCLLVPNADGNINIIVGENSVGIYSIQTSELTHDNLIMNTSYYNNTLVGEGENKKGLTYDDDVEMFTGSYVAPIGYNSDILNSFSVANTCKTDGDNYNTGKTQSKENVMYDDFNGINDECANLTIDELKNMATYGETTIDYTNIIDDGDQYIYYTDRDEITINSAEYQVNTLTYKDNQYLYFSEEYSVESEPSKQDYFVVQTDNGKQILNTKDYSIFDLETTLDENYKEYYTGAGSLINKNITNYQRIYYQSGSITTSGNTATIKNPYVIIYEDVNDNVGRIVRLTEEGGTLTFNLKSNETSTEYINDYKNISITGGEPEEALKGFAGYLVKGVLGENSFTTDENGNVTGIAQNGYDYSFDKTKDYQTVCTIGFNDITIGQAYIINDNPLYLGEISNKITFEEKSDEFYSYEINGETKQKNIITYSYEIDGTPVIENPYYIYDSQNNKVQISLQPVFEGDLANVNLIYRSYPKDGGICYVIGYLRQRTISKEFISEEQQTIINDAIDNGSAQNGGSFKAQIWDFADSGAWTIDSSGIINDGLPYLKNLPIDSYSYVSYDNSNNTYNVYISQDDSKAKTLQIGETLTLFKDTENVDYKIIDGVHYIGYVQSGEETIYIASYKVFDLGIVSFTRYWTWEDYYSITVDANDYIYTEKFNGVLFKK